MTRPIVLPPASQKGALVSRMIGGFMVGDGVLLGLLSWDFLTTGSLTRAAATDFVPMALMLAFAGMVAFMATGEISDAAKRWEAALSAHERAELLRRGANGRRRVQLLLALRFFGLFWAIPFAATLVVAAAFAWF